jgi:TRAP-type mannitol/chloroaromatic compound transport system permease large subunit
VKTLFKELPGGELGFLVFVNVLIFILGCFIDFFEIAFIVIPILAPVAAKLLPPLLPVGTPADMTLIWFGVVVAMNLQTSFLTPPFGFALFYLRSVAAKNDYTDAITKERIPAVETSQIYKGSIAFICVQLVMVVVVIAFPSLVTGGIEKTVEIDADKALQMMQDKSNSGRAGPAALPSDTAGSAATTPAPGAGDKEDPMKGLLDSIKKDGEKKP